VEYFLAEHVHCCVDDAWWVFLDLARDRYHCVPRCSVEEREPQVLERLRALGILSANHQNARAIQTTEIMAPTGSIHSPDGEVFERSMVRSFAFLRACALADRRLRRGALIRTVARVADRKRRALPALDWKRARDRVAFFRARRPWYPRDYLCLFDSLALLEFLATQGLFADWVFGVRAEPFAAHCWVQRDEVVLNDSVERVGGFVPIMRV
jgi:hypothetical protein